MAGKFYVVVKGRLQGIFQSWEDCQTQIDKFKGAVFKSFPSLEQAVQFYKKSCSNQEPKLHFSQNQTNSAEKPVDGSNSTNNAKIASSLRKRTFSEMEESHIPQNNARIVENSSKKTEINEITQVSDEETGQATSNSSIIQAQKDTVIDLDSDNNCSISLETFNTLQYKKPEEISHTGPEIVEIPDETDQNDESIEPSSRNVMEKNKNGSFEENYPKLAREFKKYSSGDAQIPSKRLWDTEIKDKSATKVYTDGACSGNGQKKMSRGKLIATPAGSGCYFEKDESRSISQAFPYENPTNQRAELFAIFLALAESKLEETLEIVSDSAYSIDSITKWSKKWEKNNYKDTNGGDVKNQDVVKPILRILAEKGAKGASVKFTWVKGHHGAYGNEMADYLARLAIGTAEYDENKFKRRRIGD